MNTSFQTKFFLTALVSAVIALGVAGVLFACGRFAVVAPAAAMSHHEEEEEKSFESTAEGELAPAK